MTHDELLAEINNFIQYTNNSGGGYALRAVVELHKPTRTPDGCGDQCPECETDYSCPTIQAIEKELNLA